MTFDKLNGPYPLATAAIELYLGKVVSAGVIVLGRQLSRTQWEVLRIDRSDSHIRARLLGHVGSGPFFCFQLCASPDEAYRLHCEMFHQLKPKGGLHPVRPDNSQAECPHCGGRTDTVSHQGVA